MNNARILLFIDGLFSDIRIPLIININLYVSSSILQSFLPPLALSTNYELVQTNQLHRIGASSDIERRKARR